MGYPTLALIIGSILSSVALVVVNKQIFALGFPYVFTLSTMHFIVTCGLLQIMARGLGLFQVKYLPFSTNLMVATFGVGSICLMNFSLKFNSVGFYQMLKLCIVPCCLAINAVSYGEYATRKVMAALFMVLVGVGIATVTDVELNAVGTLFGVAAVVVTAQYQIWQGKKQKESGLSSSQLACSVSLFQIFVGFFLAVVFEAGDLMHSEDNTANKQPGRLSLNQLIALSCILAVSVNVHSFALIGKTSAVTFQVVGHGKTCLILSSGYAMHIMANKPFSDLYKNIFGVMIALVGVGLYSNLKLNSEGGDMCDRFLPRSILQLLSTDYKQLSRGDAKV
mmetsp:Transcript_29286/g.47040  ORF Transcript_29286/g.47040 Transcript_29286/m.47040 type:complete len:336 (+) Transcript_29286:115-1122(+)